MGAVSILLVFMLCTVVQQSPLSPGVYLVIGPLTRKSLMPISSPKEAPVEEPEQEPEQEPEHEPEQEPEQEPKDCPKSWPTFEKSCYQLIQKRLSWKDAEIRCKEEGGHLASIHSKEENDFVFKVVNEGDKNHPYYWIGLEGLIPEEQFVWSDKSDLNYTNWKGGKQGSGVGGRCAQIITNQPGNNGKWFKFLCKHLAHFVCKIG